jgi:hypothetical protein
MASYPFAQFTRDVDSLVRSEQAPKILLQLVHPLMKALLAQRNWLEIVFPQMTKTDMLALGTCGDHIPDFHLLIRDHHAVDEEFYQMPFLRVMGTHCSYDHLQECYMIGSIDRITARIADLVEAGLRYLVLGPVTDDPQQIDLIAQRIAANVG